MPASDHERALARLAEMEARASKTGWETVVDSKRCHAALRAALEMHFAVKSGAFLGACVECSTPEAPSDKWTPWPCPTVRAIAEKLGVADEPR